jgi:drug/metabolite transporter (DMT)-like permease
LTRAATLFAFATITLWSFLAYLAARLSSLPPFLLVGCALSIGGLTSIARIRTWVVPLRTLAVGIGGLFGYHFLLFSAFQHAPAVEANAINYLWPLLIVLLSPVYLPQYRLKSQHIAGALLGLGGAGLVVTGGQFNLDLAHLGGYLLAAGAALVWASYSLVSKRLPHFPSTAVGGFCLVSGVLSLVLYLVSSSLDLHPLAALSGMDWLALFLLGVGPMGVAFLTWDAALKRGDPRLIGSLSYITPFTSTLVLVLLGGKRLTWVSGLAILLIIGGAIISSRDIFHQNRNGA